MSAVLEVRGLGKTFRIDRRRRLVALDDVSFSLAEGEALGVVGESGSGKSTLARLVAGLAAPSSGEIASTARAQLVFQDAGEALNPAFSARRNIAIGQGRLWLTRDVVARVAEAARAVGLSEDLLRRRPHQLSGGQQARVGLARALIADPRLLALDEPTASLDVSVQATILKLIDALRRERDMALLFVSHDLEVVRLMCDRVLVLYLGRVAECGPVSEVLRRPAHPYTRALIAASPGRGGDKPLGGEPLSPIDPPQACLFHNRCPLALEPCRRERPPTRTLGAREVACHRAEEALARLSEPAAC